MAFWRRTWGRRVAASEAVAAAEGSRVRAEAARVEAEQRRDMVMLGIVPRVEEVVAALQRHRAANHTEPLVAQAMAAPKVRLARR